MKKTDKQQTQAQPPKTGGEPKTTEHIYRVSFIDCPNEDSSRREFYFHSLAAIYDQFTPEQIGCKVTRLWNVGVTAGNTYHGRKCSVYREPIARKRHKRPDSGE